MSETMFAASGPARSWREHVALADLHADQIDAAMHAGEPMETVAQLVATVAYHTAKGLAGMAAEGPGVSRRQPFIRPSATQVDGDQPT